MASINMNNNLGIVLVIVLLVLLAWCLMTRGQSKESLSGFGVTSALNFYNRVAYCDPGYEYRGGAYSGGCFLPHRVIT